MGFGLAAPLNEPYYLSETGGTTNLVPATMNVGLGGHPYMIDWSSPEALSHQSIPLLRQQFDATESPGEQSINPEALWRRVGESWHLGAGQSQFDRPESSPFRFLRSKNINVWERWGFSLLPEVEKKLVSAHTNLFMAIAGDFLYTTNGTGIRYTSGGSWTALTGTSATPATSIASNGFHVFTAHGSDGVYRTERGTAATTKHITGTVDHIAYVRNRLMGAADRHIYDLTAIAVGSADVLPSPLFSHGNTDWEWVGFAETQNHIHVAGYSGDKSLIYSIRIADDGTTLDQPVVAANLPIGERVVAIYGYLGRFLLIGTDKGFRFSLVQGDGGVTIGALIRTPMPVLTFEGQAEFVRFGYGSMGGDGGAMAAEDAPAGPAPSTGIGRLSTAAFTDPGSLVPAYATDLCVDEETANISSIATLAGQTYFAVAGEGIYGPHASNLAEEGFLETGEIAYRLAELKRALWMDIQHGGYGHIDLYMGGAAGTYQHIDGHHLSMHAPMHSTWVSDLLQVSATSHRFMFVLHRDESDSDLGPIVDQWLFRAQARPNFTPIIIATILIAPDVETAMGTPHHYNTAAELNFLEHLNTSKELTQWQEGNRAYPVILDDYQLNIRSLVYGAQGLVGYNGSCTLKLKRVV